VYFDPDGVMVFQRVRENDPLRWTQLTPPGGGDLAPAWSPDGKRIAFRSKTSDGVGGIYVIDQGGKLPRKVADAISIFDKLSWSPDGVRIAFAGGEEDSADIYSVDVENGRVEPIVVGDGNDMSPSWAPGGDEIVFSSNRLGQWDVWAVRLSDGVQRQLTSDGGNYSPAVSPSGESIAWTKENRGVVIRHGPTGRELQMQAPRKVAYGPTWSPDERYVAVTANDWGSWDVYLLKTDGTNALLLTKNPKRDAMPAWSPDGERLALISDMGQKTLSIWTVEGLVPYLDKLETMEIPQTFNVVIYR
jgi:TolB protein